MFEIIEMTFKATLVMAQFDTAHAIFINQPL